MRRLHNLVLALACSLQLLPTAHADRHHNASIRNLLLDAIQHQDGRASSVIEGHTADQMRAMLRLGPEHVVFGDVTTVRRLSQECRRLKLTLSIPTIVEARRVSGNAEPMPDGKPLAIWYELNLCADGKPPAMPSASVNRVRPE